MKRFISAIAAGLVLLASQVAQAEVHEYQLENGLKLLVKVDSRAPVVTSQVWYKVGSSYEHGGITGVSHLLEHMMFKATKNLEPGEFNRIVADNGGRQNAFTSFDYTGYYQNFAADRLHVSFRLEADRMMGLLFSEEEFQQELRVVKEERRWRTDDNPQAKTYERFNAAAYISSPYHHPIVGWMNDLDAMTLQDAKRWYQTWYAPNNATLIVVGDVKPEAVYALAKEYFADLPAKEIPAVKPQREIEVNGERRIVVKEPANLPYLIMGYRVPSLNVAENPEEVYALEVLAYVLDGGASSRLPQRLVREQRIATSVGAGFNILARLHTQFLFIGTPAQGKTVAELRAALEAEIKDLQENPVSDAELSRIKAQVLAAKEFEKDSLYRQAMELGIWETVGLGWQQAESYADNVIKVTPEQVQTVANKYLLQDRLTVAELEPQKLENGKE